MLSLTCELFRIMFLISRFLNIIDLSFDSVVVRKYTGYDFDTFKFIEMCFTALNMVWIYHVHLNRLFILLLLYVRSEWLMALVICSMY